MKNNWNQSVFASKCINYLSKWYQKAENWKVIITVIVTASLNEDEYFEYKVCKMNINFKDID